MNNLKPQPDGWQFVPCVDCNATTHFSSLVRDVYMLRVIHQDGCIHKEKEHVHGA